MKTKIFKLWLCTIMLCVPIMANAYDDWTTTTTATKTYTISGTVGDVLTFDYEIHLFARTEWYESDSYYGSYVLYQDDATIKVGGNTLFDKKGSTSGVQTYSGTFSYTFTSTGNVTLSAKLTKKTSKAYLSIRNIKASAPTTTGTPTDLEYVDLGLTSGTLWANMNVGATAPEEYGNYYAWGETSPKSTYTWANYRHCNGTGTSIKKYCTDSSYGTVDNKTELELTDDAAYVNWGRNWRMPTNAQYEEIISECTWTWTTLNGINGYEVKSQVNGNAIFLPAAGMYNEALKYEGTVIGLWSKKLSMTATYMAIMFATRDNGVTYSVTGSNRFDGRSVRPVYYMYTSSITLEPQTIGMGATVTLEPTILPWNATNKKLTWTSSDESIATVDANGAVTGVNPGIATITATATDGSGVKGTCEVTVKGVPPAGLEYVDLGLSSGTLWANMNVGATAPEEYGNYYAWGETATKSNYDWSTYKYSNGTNTTIKKYCTNSNYGTVDNKTELELIDDAAFVNWGENWHMPTLIQIYELHSECSWEQTTLNGKTGYQITGPNGNTIFLPAAGLYDKSTLRDTETRGWYWSNTIGDLNDAYAWITMLRPTGASIENDTHWRAYGRSVRPVYYIYVSSISLTSFSLKVGGSATMVPVILPDNATNKSLIWNSSDENVATVDTNGVVTANAVGTATITATATDGSDVIGTCEVTVADNYEINDGDVYDQSDELEVNTLTYTRNFSNTKWQALYVPFSMDYEEWNDNFHIARIEEVQQWDDDGDGVMDRTEMEIVRLKSGSSTVANTPYLIKAKATGLYTFTLAHKTLYPSEENMVSVPSGNIVFAFTGTYSGVPGTEMMTNGYFALGGGILHKATDATYSLSPYRWYMTIVDSDGYPVNLGEVKIMCQYDDWEETSIDELTMENGQLAKRNVVYDLSGRKMNVNDNVNDNLNSKLKKGIYINDGKMFIVR